SRPRIHARPPPNSEIAAKAWRAEGICELGPIQCNGSWILLQPWGRKALPAARRTARRPSEAVTLGGSRRQARSRRRLIFTASCTPREGRGKPLAGLAPTSLHD